MSVLGRLIVGGLGVAGLVHCSRAWRSGRLPVSADDLAALEDTLELLSDPTAMADIEHARREVKAGHIVSADEMRAKYLRR